MEKFLTFIREHVREIAGRLPWNKMAASTQKDASISPEVMDAIMRGSWIRGFICFMTESCSTLAWNRGLA